MDLDEDSWINKSHYWVSMTSKNHFVQLLPTIVFQSILFLHECGFFFFPSLWNILGLQIQEKLFDIVVIMWISSGREVRDFSIGEVRIP